MSTSQSKDKKHKFKMHLTDSIAHDQTEHGEQVRQMLRDISQGLGEILGPEYMGVAVGGGSSKSKTITKLQQNKISLAEKLASNDLSVKSLRIEEVRELFPEAELENFLTYMDGQTVGYNKSADTTYYYLNDIIRYIKGIAPAD